MSHKKFVVQMLARADVAGDGSALPSVSPGVRPGSRAENPGKSARVQCIARAMESGEWDGEASYVEFAALLAVAPRTIQNDADDAARMLRHAISDDEVKAWADAHLKHLTDLARDGLDYSNARGAIRDRLDARGLLVSKQQTTVTLERVTDPDLLKAALVEVCATEEGRQMLLEKAREIEGKGTQ